VLSGAEKTGAAKPGRNVSHFSEFSPNDLRRSRGITGDSSKHFLPALFARVFYVIG
jgi:hypothetical protein